MFGSTAGASSVGGGGGFGTPSTPAFTGSSLFTTPFSAQSQSQQSPFFSQQLQTPPQLQFPGLQTPPPPLQLQTPPQLQFPGLQPPPLQLQTPPQPQFPGLQTPPPPLQQHPSVNAASLIPFTGGQLTTQMAPVAPLPFSLADRDIQAIVDAYREDPANPKYAFKHLLFSVTDLQFRVKLASVSDIMWAEAMGKLEGMNRADRERLWPQLVQGFKDLSNRLKLQDGVILSDAERLKTTQTNVKMLQRHFQADTLPRIQRMRQKEQNLQRRLLRVMRIVEALEGKGCRLPLVKGEAQLAEKLAIITKQLKGSGAELSRRVQSLLAISRSQTNGLGATGSLYLPGSMKIDGQSLADLQEVLQQQTAAIARLGNVLKRDIRDVEIMMADDTEMTEDAS